MTKDQLATKTLEAVDRLLEVIKSNPNDRVGGHSNQGGGGSYANGTSGYFAAQAIRSLLETPLLSEAVKVHLDTTSK